MELPIGMLIFKAQCITENETSLTGIWYFQDMSVPGTKAEKLISPDDLKRKRCTVLTLLGTYDQICELIMQSDKYIGASESQINAFARMRDQLLASNKEPLVFDEIFAIKGTSLSVDTVVKVDDEMAEVKAKIYSWKPMSIWISKDWTALDFL